MKLTDYQNDLLAKLAASENGKMFARFNGDFLNCRVAVEGVNGKTKWQRFSFVFDSSGDCQGSRLVPRSLRGAYSEVFARRAADVILEHSRAIGAEEVTT